MSANLAVDSYIIYFFYFPKKKRLTVSTTWMQFYELQNEWTNNAESKLSFGNSSVGVVALSVNMARKIPV